MTDERNAQPLVESGDEPLTEDERRFLEQMQGAKIYFDASRLHMHLFSQKQLDDLRGFSELSTLLFTPLSERSKDIEKEVQISTDILAFMQVVINAKEELAAKLDKEGRGDDMARWLSMSPYALYHDEDFKKELFALPHAKEDAEHFSAKLSETLQLPLDKPNSKIWDMLVPAEKTGQLNFAFDTRSYKDGKEEKNDAHVIFSINFDELSHCQITKSLTPYDKRVYIACDALWKAGNEVVSASQVYRMMGNAGTPSAAQLKKINTSLSKMRSAIIYVDNEPETKAGYKYPRFVYDGSLLPFERKTCYFRNNIAESALHLLRRPPMADFAEQRGQVTKITRALLESPINKTEKNLAIEDYLLERIARMKHERGQRTILIETLCDTCHITGKKDKQRLPEKLKKYLEHYKKCDFIKDFSLTGEKIQIKL